jgi:peptidyl-prolyl cis-trans isomerase C
VNVRRAVSIVTIAVLAACSRTAPANATPQAAPTPAASAQSAPPAPAATPQAPAPAAAAKSVPAQLPEVVARVNGEAISGKDLDDAVRAIAGRAGPIPPDERDRVYRGVLDNMIGYRLMIQEAKARKITVPDAEVDAQVAQIRAQFPSDAQFQQALTAQRTTLEAVRNDARDGMSADKLVESEIAGKVAVKPEAVTDFYQKNQDKFQQGPRVRASHILIGIPQNADAATKQQAKAKADGLLKDLKAGKDFAAAAKENSQDPGSAPNGGDLGYFEQGQMVPPFEQAAFALKPGEVSEVVETQFGYHIIKVAEKQESRVVPLEEAKGQIEEYLTQQNRHAQTELFVNALRAKAKVEILI